MREWKLTNAISAPRCGNKLMDWTTWKETHLFRLAGLCGTALFALPLAGCAGGSARTSAAPPICRTNQLALRAGQADAGMGHVTQALVLERRGTGSCRLFGTPRVQLLDSHGAPLPTVQRTTPYPLVPGRMPPMIRLAPGEKAHFTVHYATATGYGSERCPTAAALAVTPPGATGTLHLKLSITAYGGTVAKLICGELLVSALSPGAP
ncbi:MAG: DUF4232 domain-containing protein [Acidihalobacter sp.]|jgi:hypothetical protein|uniref:DUF4232 domain-containing protein n=1 Tax=Acidihalobacter sp. TaxID=1872108 RepID=UPI00307F981B